MANRDVAAIILAGGHGEKLSVISEKRAIASVPFGGKYRIIDYTLSNIVNSGIFSVMVLTQYRPLSLHQHIGSGKPWDLDRLRGGIRVMSPYMGRRDSGWDRGTADAVYQNVDEINQLDVDNLLILGSDHIYTMDYRPMLELHLEKEADVTIGAFHSTLAEASRFGVVSTDADGRVLDFEEKPPQPKSNLVSMGIYMFNKTTLLARLEEDAADKHSQHDFGRNILPKMIADSSKVYAYSFNGYWQDVGTIQSYWEAHMSLLADTPAFDMYERDWVVYTRSEERPPAMLGETSSIERSLISNGCQVRGQVIHSVLSPGVIVEEGAIVRDSVIMTDTVIGKNAVVDRAIVDKEVLIGSGAVIGDGDDTTPNKSEPQRLHSGVTIIGKGAKLPDGIKVGRNCKISPDVQVKDFKGKDLASGESLEKK